MQNLDFCNTSAVKRDNLGVDDVNNQEQSKKKTMLNSIVIPDGVNDTEVRSILINKFQIEIGGGLGPLAGRIWRIGLMGETAKEENIHILMDAYRKILK